MSDEDAVGAEAGAGAEAEAGAARPGGDAEPQGAAEAAVADAGVAEAEAVEGGVVEGNAVEAERVEAEAVEERHASWLELFFDLLFVAIVAQLAHGLVGHVGVARVFAVAGLFVPAWWAWVSFTVFSDVVEDDSAKRRIAVLSNMACLVMLGGGVSPALHGHPALFALGYGLSRLVRTGHVLLVPSHPVNVAEDVRAEKAADAREDVRAEKASDAREYIRAEKAPHARTVESRSSRLHKLAKLTPFLISAVFWLVAVAVPPPACYVLWAAGLAIELAVSARTSPRSVGIDPVHLAERFGLFVIIVLGEGIAQIVASLGGGVRTGSVATLTGVAAFVLFAAVWWLYFDFGNAAALAVIQARPDEAWNLTRDGFAYGHFLLVGGIMTMAAGAGSAVAGAAQGSAANPDAVRVVCGGLAAYLANNAVISIGPLGVPLSRIAQWFIPNLIVIGVIWAFAGHLAPGWALLALAAGLSAVAAQSLQRAARRAEQQAGRRVAA